MDILDRVKNFSYKKKFQLKNNIDDFIGFACLELVKNNKRDLEHIYIDFIRHELGRTGNKINYNTTSELIDDLYGEDTQNSILENKDEEEFSMTLLSLEEKLIYTLLKKEYSLKQIGLIFNVTESRICQKIKTIRSKIEKTLFRAKIKRG